MSHLSHPHANPNSQGQILNLTLTQKNILLTLAVIVQLILGALVLPSLNISGQTMNWVALAALAIGALLPLLAKQGKHVGTLYVCFIVGVVFGCIIGL